MHLEDRLSAAHIGPVKDHAPVEAPRPQQSRVQDVGPVGCGDDDYIGVGVKAIHLNEHLIQGLLALVVAATQACAALAADRIDLVDEDNTRRVAFGLIEQIAHPAGANADEHLDELGSRYGEERHACFSGDRFRKQGLTRAWGTHQQDAFGDASA